MGAVIPRSLSYSYDDDAPDLGVVRGSTTIAIAAACAIWRARGETMTSSVSPAAAASQPQLHITTTGTSTGSTAIISPSSNQSTSNARSSSPHSTSSPPRGPSTTGGTGSGGGSGSGCTNQACAACKYQRRKCNTDCPLAPYFPADQQERFLNSHRLFGVRKILKTLENTSPELSANAMATLIFQSDMRAQDPVGGCYHLILSLERQLQIEMAEHSAMVQRLALFRQAATTMPPDQGGGTVGLDYTASSKQPLFHNAQQEVVYALYKNNHGGGHGPNKDDHGGQQHQVFDYYINLDNMQQFHFNDSCAAVDKVDLTPAGADEMRHHQHFDENCQIDHKDYFEIKAAALVDDAFDMRQEVVDVCAEVDMDTKTVDVNAGIGGVDIKAMGMNANVDVNVSTPQMAAEPSHCRLGLGFSSF
jgi:hypothetical protein